MKILIFDTETTGLPKNNFVRVMTSNLQDWPYIVQFSYVIFNTETMALEKIVDHIVSLPEEAIISDESIALHGITHTISREQGIKISDVLLEFLSDMKNADHIVAHNLEFDLKMITVEYYRLVNTNLNTADHITYMNAMASTINPANPFKCTMRESSAMCNIVVTRPDKSEYVKFPKLSELHQHLFGYVPGKLHNSLNDVIICLRCFYKMHFNRDLCLENKNIHEMITAQGGF